MLKPDANFYDQLLVIQQTDFVCLELNLYLNTHPNDQQAINQFNEFARQSKMLKQQFESTYGPLMHGGQSYSPAPWVWNNPPWPWQI